MPILTLEECLMKKWEEAEDKINTHLHNKYEEAATAAQKKLKKTKESGLELFINIYNKILPIFEMIKTKLKSISKIDPKEVLSNIKHVWEELDLKKMIRTFRIPPQPKLKSLVRENKLQIVFSIIFFFGIFKTIQSVRHYFIKPGQDRTIASVETINKRPKYYLLGKKLLKIDNIRVPVALNGNKRISTIMADIVVECPTRTAQKFLYNSPELVYDKLNSTIAPQINSFPLTDEGKRILKQKIRFEIGQLLKENHFENYKINRVNLVQVTSS